MDLLAGLFENILEVLDSGLEGAGVPYAYGFAIIALTCLVKLATFPLTQKQVRTACMACLEGICLTHRTQARSQRVLRKAG